MQPALHIAASLVVGVGIGIPLAIVGSPNPTGLPTLLFGAVVSIAVAVGCLTLVRRADDSAQSA